MAKFNDRDRAVLSRMGINLGSHSSVGADSNEQSAPIFPQVAMLSNALATARDNADRAIRVAQVYRSKYLFWRSRSEILFGLLMGLVTLDLLALAWWLFGGK